MTDDDTGYSWYSNYKTVHELLNEEDEIRHARRRSFMAGFWTGVSLTISAILLAVAFGHIQ